MADLTAREQAILHRLRENSHATASGAIVRTPVSGFSSPADHEILIAMAERGLVRIWPGEGRDRGRVLAQLPAAPSRLRSSTGGDAA